MLTPGENYSNYFCHNFQANRVDRTIHVSYEILSHPPLPSKCCVLGLFLMALLSGQLCVELLLNLITSQLVFPLLNFELCRPRPLLLIKLVDFYEEGDRCYKFTSNNISVTARNAVVSKCFLMY